MKFNDIRLDYKIVHTYEGRYVFIHPILWSHRNNEVFLPFFSFHWNWKYDLAVSGMLLDGSPFTTILFFFIFSLRPKAKSICWKFSCLPLVEKLGCSYPTGRNMDQIWKRESGEVFGTATSLSSIDSFWLGCVRMYGAAVLCTVLAKWMSNEASSCWKFDSFSWMGG